MEMREEDIRQANEWRNTSLLPRPQPPRSIHAREGRLYEGDQALKVRTSEVGVAIGCTVITWAAYDAIIKRVALLGRQPQTEERNHESK
jgi:hypothetical protein